MVWSENAQGYNAADIAVGPTTNWPFVVFYQHIQQQQNIKQYLLTFVEMKSVFERYTFIIFQRNILR